MTFESDVSPLAVTITPSSKIRNLLKITSYKEMKNMENFSSSVDPTKTTPTRILGSYKNLREGLCHCGLKSCHTCNGKGYLIEFDEGLLTNVGHICGKNNWGLNFEQIVGEYKIQERIDDLKESIRLKQIDLPTLGRKIDFLWNGENQGSYICKEMNFILNRWLDSDQTKALQERARKGVNEIVREAKLEGNNAHAAKATGNYSGYEQKVLGSINGLRAVKSHVKLRKTLAITYSPSEIDRISNLDISNLTLAELRKVHNWITKINEKVKEAEGIIEECHRFLVISNLNLLKQLASYL